MDFPLALYLLTWGVTSSHAALTVIDMTFDLSDDTIYWPGSPPFNFTQLVRGRQAAGYWYESNSFFTAEHGGTHVDAPAHFYEGGWRAHQIPASNLVGPAVVVDVTSKAAANPDYLLTVQDLKEWENKHGRIPDKAIVIMNSGWDARYPNPFEVFNTDTPTNTSTFHFPGIHPNASTFLATQRDVIAVGVDTPSTDFGQSTTFETHVVLAQHNIIGLENLVNVGDLPSLEATVVIGLVKLRDGSGGPGRILGIVGDGSLFGPTGTASSTFPLVRIWVCSIMLLWFILTGQ